MTKTLRRGKDPNVTSEGTKVRSLGASYLKTYGPRWLDKAMKSLGGAGSP